MLVKKQCRSRSNIKNSILKIRVCHYPRKPKSNHEKLIQIWQICVPTYYTLYNFTSKQASNFSLVLDFPLTSSEMPVEATKDFYARMICSHYEIGQEQNANFFQGDNHNVTTTTFVTKILFCLFLNFSLRQRRKK